MRKFAPFLLLAAGIFSVVSIYAQQGKESLVPLQSNPRLQAEAQSHPAVMPTQSFFQKKASVGQRFPFIDWFDQAGTELYDTLWDLKLVKRDGAFAVFNAQNESGNTYAGGDGSFGETDVLLSREIDISGSNNQLFISFQYGTGSTWQSGDSLVLQLETPSGNYVSIWQSPNIVLASTTIRINIPLADYNSSAFRLRFKSYANRLGTNTQSFVLKNVVLADKLVLPFYERFLETAFNDSSAPSEFNWQRAQASIFGGGGIGGGNAAAFNAFDKTGNIYTNNGYGDTLHSMPMNLIRFASNDSIFLNFTYRSMPAADQTDSLILEGLNNTGLWIRIWQISASGLGVQGSFSQQVNIGRFRHENFQFRLLSKSNYSSTDTLQFLVSDFNIGLRLKIPFVDDFSTTTLFPSATRWTNKLVYINNDFPINPPSVNVATFDGLNDLGNAYGQGNGYLDTLTSRGLLLSGLTRSDSVYLSFYVQPQGLGDMPNANDSLVLEFRNLVSEPATWTKVWIGLAPQFTAAKFTEVYVLVDSMYLHADFQFRFRNYGSRTGNIDNWHVDYIRLDRGRSKGDGYFDFAATVNPPSLLKTYASMPRNHYNANPAGYTNTNQSLGISNNDTTAFPLNFGRVVFDPDQTQLNTFTNTLPNVGGKTVVSATVNSSFALTTSQTTDSLIFSARYFVNQNNNQDNIPSNDTIQVQTVFSNYFAYDDGTAEAGYGIEIEPGAVALGYKLETADQLYGLSMLFNQSFVDVSTQAFTLCVWSALGTNGDGTGEIPLKKILQSRPSYMNQRNGFYYLKFDQPLALPAGKFYIGWEQESVFQLNMGFDMNYKVNGVSAKNPDQWFHVKDGIWGRTQLNGALMMRPILGKWIDPPVGMVEVEKKFDVVIYPNPASNFITIETLSENELLIELRDLQGKQWLSVSGSEKSISLLGTPSGMYFVTITDKVTGDRVTKKLLIN